MCEFIFVKNLEILGEVFSSCYISKFLVVVGGLVYFLNENGINYIVFNYKYFLVI